MRFTVIAFFILLTCRSYSQGPNRLNLEKGSCEPIFDGTKSLEPTKINDFNFKSKEFIDKLPACKEQLTCLTPARLNLLSERQFIPSGINTLGDLINKKQSSCYSYDPLSNNIALLQNSQSIFEHTKVYPIETEDILNLIKKVKSRIDNYLRLSKYVNQAILTCLKLNKKYTSNANKIDSYKKDLKSDSKLPRICEAVWKRFSGDNNNQMNKDLAAMRQVLSMLHLLKSTKFQSISEFQIALKNYDSLPQKNIFKSNLKPLKNKIAQYIPFNNFWSQTPDELDILTEHEKAGLFKLSEQILASDKSISNIDELKDHLMFSYYSLISYAPILVHFTSAEPDDDEMISAFEKYTDKTKNVSKLKMESVDYLFFIDTLNEVIENELPERKGDLCVLAEHALSSRQALKDSPQTLALLLSSKGIESLIIQKGLLKKIAGTLSDSKISGYLLSMALIQNGMRQITIYNSTCLTVGAESNGSCRVDSIEAGANEVIVGPVLSSIFGAGSKVKAILKGKK